MLVNVVVVSAVHVAVVVVIDVRIMLYRFVAALCAVLVVMTIVVQASVVAGFQHAVLVHVPFVREVVMAIVNVVGMVTMLYGLMAAFRTVLVLVTGVLSVGRGDRGGHGLGNRGRSRNWRRLCRWGRGARATYHR